MNAISPKTLIVNAITFSRVPLIVGFCVAAVCGELSRSCASEIAACALMLFAGLSDLWDGMLARKWNVVSNFGKMADPLMDKVFFIVAFPTLLWLVGEQGESVAHGLVLLAFTILWILRDLWVTFMRSVASAYGADVAAMWTGKVRTALSFPAAGLVYVYLAFHRLAPAGAQDALLWCTYALEAFLMALNAYSFVVYTKAYAPYLKKALAPTK